MATLTSLLKKHTQRYKLQDTIVPASISPRSTRPNRILVPLPPKPLHHTPTPSTHSPLVPLRREPVKVDPHSHPSPRTTALPSTTSPVLARPSTRTVGGLCRARLNGTPARRRPAHTSLGRLGVLELFAILACPAPPPVVGGR